MGNVSGSFDVKVGLPTFAPGVVSVNDSIDEEVLGSPTSAPGGVSVKVNK